MLFSRFGLKTDIDFDHYEIKRDDITNGRRTVVASQAVSGS